MDVTALMEKAIGQQAADLHLQTGRPPMLRLAQGLCSFPGPPLSEDDVRCLLHAVGWTRDEVGDGAFSWRRSLRCRLHVCREYAGLHATIRFLYPLASLPPDGDGPLLERLSRLTQGLVLVCGPTGSGKTTALWRILQAINERRPCHIITLEDPIEYVEKGKAALITQRELGTHFPDFAEGIRQALRQDPDVILIGEMRDRPAMDAALMAAETGHFVLSTLHTPSAAQAVSRIAGAYSGDARQEVRYRLAMVLQAVLAQRRLEGQGQVEIVREILVRTPAVVQLIRSGIPLVQAWQLLMADMPGRYRRPLHLAALQMEQGVCPSQAMNQCRAFPELACRLIRAGEQTGNLEGLCRVLADFYETKGKERRLLVQALAYPAFLLVCLILLTAGACLFIIPVFTDMMDQLAVPLPKGTQYLLAAMGALRHYGVYGLAGLTVGLLVLRWAWQQAKWRLELERQFFRLPWLQTWVLVWAWQRFSQILAVQLAGGIPLLDSLPKAAAVVPSRLFRQYILQARLLLERGCAFSQAVHAGRFGTPYVETMLAVGEMTGRYDEALASISRYYGSRLQQLAGRLQRWLGPVVLLLTGALMGFLILCFLLPLLDMASSVVT